MISALAGPGKGQNYLANLPGLAASGGLGHL